MTSRNGSVTKLKKMLERDGWVVTQSRGSCHYHVRDPETGQLVSVFASSPSHNALDRIYGDIKRYLRRKEQAEGAA